MALATEERFSPVLLENPSFSAASLAVPQTQQNEAGL
jgi:hypothetical protein